MVYSWTDHLFSDWTVISIGDHIEWKMYVCLLKYRQLSYICELKINGFTSLSQKYSPIKENFFLNIVTSDDIAFTF